VYIFKNHFTWLAGEGMKFGQLILMKIIKTVGTTHQMADFKAKMH